MFVSASVSIDVPFAAVRHRLLEHLRCGELDALASQAYGEGIGVFALTGVAGLSKTVEIHSVSAYQRGVTTVVPLRWMATGVLGSAFPVLDANLELAAVESGTELLVLGSYLPPLGTLGAAVDRLVLHDVGQATVRCFAAQLAGVAMGDPVT
jgi:hypothetical protein